MQQQVPNPAAVVMILAVLGSIVAAWIWMIVRLALRKSILPADQPHVVPWGIGSVVLSAVTWLGLQFVVPIVYIVALLVGGAVVRGQQPNTLISPAAAMSLSAISNALSLLFIPLILAGLARARGRDLGLGSGRGGFWRQVGQGMLAYPVIAPVVFGAMLLATLVWKPTHHPLQDAIQGDTSIGMRALVAIAGAILAPAAEELLFRGVLLGYLTKFTLRRRPTNGLQDPLFLDDKPAPVDPFDRFEPFDTATATPAAGSVGHLDPFHDPLNPYTAPTATLEPPPRPLEPGQVEKSRGQMILANVLVSVLFAGMHFMVWPSPIPLFFVSLGLGVLYQRTGSIVAPIALHVTFNSVSTLLMFLGVGDPAQPPKPEAPLEPVPPPGIVRIIEPADLRSRPTVVFAKNERGH